MKFNTGRGNYNIITQWCLNLFFEPSALNAAFLCLKFKHFVFMQIKVEDCRKTVGRLERLNKFREQRFYLVAVK